jgi:hypothetical protein
MVACAKATPLISKETVTASATLFQLGPLIFMVIAFQLCEQACRRKPNWLDYDYECRAKSEKFL